LEQRGLLARRAQEDAGLDHRSSTAGRRCSAGPSVPKQSPAGGCRAAPWLGGRRGRASWRCPVRSEAQPPFRLLRRLRSTHRPEPMHRPAVVPKKSLAHAAVRSRSCRVADVIWHPSLGHGVGMPMGHLPLAALAAIHLGGPQGVTARLTVDGDRGVHKDYGTTHNLSGPAKCVTTTAGP
jgi:hypothetical protein